MKISIVTLLYNEKSLEEAARYISGLGYQMVELAAWKDSPHFRSLIIKKRLESVWW